MSYSPRLDSYNKRNYFRTFEGDRGRRVESRGVLLPVLLSKGETGKRPPVPNQRGSGPTGRPRVRDWQEGVE